MKTVFLFFSSSDFFLLDRITYVANANWTVLMRWVTIRNTKYDTGYQTNDHNLVVFCVKIIVQARCLQQCQRL